MNTRPRIVKGMDGRWVLFVIVRGKPSYYWPVIPMASRVEMAYSSDTWSGAVAMLSDFYAAGIVLRDRE